MLHDPLPEAVRERAVFVRGFASLERAVGVVLEQEPRLVGGQTICVGDQRVDLGALVEADVVRLSPDLNARGGREVSEAGVDA